MRPIVTEVSHSTRTASDVVGVLTLWRIRVQVRQQQQQQQQQQPPVIVKLFEKPQRETIIEQMKQKLRSCATIRYEEYTESFTGTLRRGNVVKLGGQSFKITQKLGEGGYAVVYHVIELMSTATTEWAMKVQDSCTWDVFISGQIEGRAKMEHRHWFCPCVRGSQFKDKGFSIMPRGGHTLEQLLNAYIRRGKAVHELTAMFFVVELLKIVECLHECNILHLDIKPDNLLLRMPGGPADQGGFQLIDFGRSIDLELLPTGFVLVGDSGVSGFRCAEMKHQQPWCYQPDRYAIGCVAHFLLMGTTLPVDATAHASMKSVIRMKRYWQCHLWKQLFSRLLDMSGPISSVTRQPLEEYLAGYARINTVRAEVAQHQWMLDCCG